MYDSLGLPAEPRGPIFSEYVYDRGVPQVGNESDEEYCKRGPPQPIYSCVSHLYQLVWPTVGSLYVHLHAPTALSAAPMDLESCRCTARIRRYLRHGPQQPPHLGTELAAPPRNHGFPFITFIV